MNIEKRWQLPLALSCVVSAMAGMMPAADIPAPSLDPASVLESRTELQKRFAYLFTPFKTEIAALSPDGKYIAYSVREGEEVSVKIVEIDHPEILVSKVTVASDERSTPIMQVGSSERTPAQIRWMRWATPTRLVVETNTNFIRQVDESWVNVAGAILAFDADGKNDKLLITPIRVAEQLQSADMTTGTGEDAVSTAAIAAATTRFDSASYGTTTTTTTDDDDLTQSGLTTQPQPTSRMHEPHAVDFVADDPEWLLVRTNAGLRYRVFKVNVMTGALKFLSQDTWEEGMTPLINRQGRPNAGISNWSRTPFPQRFVWETNRFMKRWVDLDEVAGIADGVPGFTVSPENFLGERAFPVGFDENPNILYFAANIGRDTFGIYDLDLAAGKRGGLVIENPGLDMAIPALSGFPGSQALVFDRFARKLVGIRTESAIVRTTWFRQDLMQLQAALENGFPGRTVEILEWNAEATRFLVLIYGITTPGAFYIYDLADGRMSEFAGRAPWMDNAIVPITVPFTLQRPEGGTCQGVISLPRRARSKNVPIVVRFGAEPWAQVSSEYQGDVEALVDMGLAVLQVNARGTWGNGRAHRAVESSDIAELQGQDVLFAIDELAKRFPLNTSRVALVGSQRGAYIALRAMQLFPDRFRCAVSLDGTIDPAAWMEEMRWSELSSSPALMRGAFGSEKILTSSPLLKQPEAIKRPVMFLAYRGPADRSTPLNDFVRANRLASALRSAGTPVEFHELNDDYMYGRPRAFSEAFGRMEKFINANLYDFEVKLEGLEILE